MLKISKGMYRFEDCVEYIFCVFWDKGFCVWFEMLVDLFLFIFFNFD